MPMLIHSAPFALDVLGRNGVEPGVPTSFTVEEAGHPPVPRLAAAMLELHHAIEARDHALAAGLRDEIAGKDDIPGLDYGSGLLAQDIWAKAPAKRGAATDNPEGDS